MHDISDLERRGIPGVFVASEGFIAAAETPATALGPPPARRVLVFSRPRRIPDNQALYWAGRWGYVSANKAQVWMFLRWDGPSRNWL